MSAETFLLQGRLHAHLLPLELRQLSDGTTWLVGGGTQEKIPSWLAYLLSPWAHVVFCSTSALAASTCFSFSRSCCFHSCSFSWASSTSSSSFSSSCLKRPQQGLRRVDQRGNSLSLSFLLWTFFSSFTVFSSLSTFSSSFRHFFFSCSSRLWLYSSCVFRRPQWLWNSNLKTEKEGEEIEEMGAREQFIKIKMGNFHNQSSKNAKKLQFRNILYYFRIKE